MRRCVIRSGNLRFGAVECEYAFAARAKCPGVELPGECAAYSPRPRSFTTVSDRSPNFDGFARRSDCRKRSRLFASALAGREYPNEAASITIRSHLSGVFTTRRRLGKLFLSRNRAVA